MGTRREDGQYDPSSDEGLMLAAAGGDMQAFENLVLRHEAPLVRFFFRHSRNHQRSEDLAQEVFIKLHIHVREYEPRARFTTYLYRIAHNQWVDDCRRRKRERGQASLDAEDSGGGRLLDVVASPQDGPREVSRREEIADAVVDAVDALPEEHKAVFVLAEVRGLKYAEISGILEIPVGTVKSRMHAAVKRLRERLAVLKPRNGE